MSRWPTERALALHIDAAGWVLSAPSGELARAQRPIGAQALVHELEALRLAAAPGRAAVDVTLHDSWIRSFVVAPPASTRSLAELRQCTRVRFESLFGDDGDAWTFRAAFHASHPFVAIAMRTPLLAALRGLCERHGWRLRSVHALWARSLAAQAWPREAQWWAAASSGAVTVVHTRAKSVSTVRTSALADVASPGAVQAIVERSRLLAQPTSDDNQPVRWLEASSQLGKPARGPLDLLDFAGTNARWALPSRRRSWPAVATAALALAVGVAVAAHWHELLLEHANNAARLAGVAPQRPAPAAAAAPPSLSAAQMDAANNAVHRLNTPWPAIFGALERAIPADVALLSIEPDGRQARVRGMALARSYGAMLEFMDRLSATPPFADARLVRHETDERDPVKPLRFQFEVTLRVSAGSQGASH